MSLIRNIVGQRSTILLALGATLALMNAAHAAIDREAVAYPTSTPRVNLPIQLYFGFYNHGNSNALNVRVTNTLPAQFVLLSTRVVIGDNVTISNQGNKIIVTFPFVQPETYALAACMVQVGQTGFYTNLTQLSRLTQDANRTNDTLRTALEVRPPMPHVRGFTVSETNGPAPVAEVWLDASNTAPVSVQFRTLQGTAVEGVDYAPVTNTVVLPPGVTTQAVHVPLINDIFDEPNSFFTVELISATNADLLPDEPRTTVNILDDEPAPLAFIDDVTVTEGDEGITEATFHVSISPPSLYPVGVSWSVADGSARHGGFYHEDYFGPTSGPLIFEGTNTNAFVTLSVWGDVLIEDDETFQVNLSGLNPPGFGRSQATCTILNDDGLPGKPHHLEISAVPSPQLVGRPFPVTVKVMDILGAPVTNFNDVAWLQIRTGPTDLFFTYISNFVNGVWTGLAEVTSPVTNALASGQVRLGQYGYGSNSFVVLPSPLPTLALPAFVTEGQGFLPGAGNLTLPRPDIVDVTFTLTTTRQLEVIFPSTITIPAGQTNAVFDLTVGDDTLLDGTWPEPITATAPGYQMASFTTRIKDDETAILSWIMPSSVSETGRSFTATLNLSAPPPTNVLITVSHNAPNRLSASSGGFISPGQTSVVYTVNVLDDKIIQGPQSVQLTAHVDNWTDAIGAITLLDNESTNIILRYRGVEAPTLVEGQGTFNNLLTVIFDGNLASSTIVTLTSSDPTVATVPAAVTNLAGTSSVNFPVTILDDNNSDGRQTAIITASAPGFRSSTQNVTVQDNEVHHFAFSIPGPPTAGSPYSGVPFPVTITSKTVDNDTITAPFDSALTLAAFGPNGPLSLIPSNILSGQRGSWSQNITTLNWGSDIVLTATATNGITGRSTPFVIRPPTWSTNLSLIRAEIAGNDVRLHLASRPGHTYLLERTDTLPAPAWTHVGAAVTATTDQLVIIDSGGASRPGRFYRLALLP